ncbi:ribokinase [Paenibacillus daejeonensis]|uniref:ribokinase n=1 Tax=Paenibacillus daejeonensis TaxID=135193 RepID=UPI00035EFE49|nr:ribokinase [Paenibacillus daejeonensis]
MANILVVGSMNMDIVTQVAHHPLPGETVQGLGTAFHAGGKGANQAVAAARSGAAVAMAGGLGADVFGQDLRQRLMDEGMELSGIIEMSDAATGVALITIERAGENRIILSPGANGEYGPAEADALELNSYEAILLQNEIPLATCRRVMERAAAEGIPVFLNPAPIAGFDPALMAHADYLVLNEVEAEVLSGLAIHDADAAARAARKLLESGVSRLILTLGSQGSLYKDQEGLQIRMPAFRVEAVDTTAAGDTFIGAFAARRTNGATVEEALHYATAASALAVTARGAQSSIPTEAQVASFLAEIGQSLDRSGPRP